MRWWRFRRSSPLSANAMKHPARSDFHTVVTAAGVSVTFKPTNSTYSFYRFAGSGTLSLAGIQHAGCDVDNYPSDEVQDMAQQIASGHASVHILVRFKIRKRSTEFIGKILPGKRNATWRTRPPLICACWPRSKNGWRSFAKSVASSQNATASITPSSHKPNFH